MTLGIHTVKKGDTLWSLSRVYHVPIKVIMEFNGLDSDLLVPGLALYIPDWETPERLYRVKEGETLWGIAKQMGITVEDIFKVNHPLNPYGLAVGQYLNIPAKLNLKTLGFLDASGVYQPWRIFSRYGEQLTYLAIFSYTVNYNGTLEGVDDFELLEECSVHSIKPLMVVTNFTGDPFHARLIKPILSNDHVRQSLIRSIAYTLEEKGFYGVSIDFESIPVECRSYFTTFLKELKKAIGNSNLLHVNLPAKTRDDPENTFTGAYDYSSIANIADIIAVMTIDYCDRSFPNPISPIGWVEDVIYYSSKIIDPKKLMIAIGFYGYDWPLTKQQKPPKSSSISTLNAQKQAILNKVSIQYDGQSKTPWYRYVKNEQEHIVWFEDVRSLMAKIKIVETFGLLGVTFWELKYEFPQNWAYMRKNIRVIKN